MSKTTLNINLILSIIKKTSRSLTIFLGSRLVYLKSRYIPLCYSSFRKYTAYSSHISNVKKRLNKNSISGENEVNLPTIKRIVSSFSIPDTMRFSDLRGFFLSLFLILAFLNLLQLIKSFIFHLLFSWRILVLDQLTRSWYQR